MPKSDFAGLRVLSLESRRAQEMAKLISNFGGHPIVAPSMREVPLEENTEALNFAAALKQGQLDMVIFLTGVGIRGLTKVVETLYSRDEFVATLSKVAVVARGPKPLAALRELGVRVSLTVPEPNTWRELLQALDDTRESLPLNGTRVAVQEYGISNPELLEGLVARGASVTSVPVYQWKLRSRRHRERPGLPATQFRSISGNCRKNSPHCAMQSSCWSAARLMLPCLPALPRCSTCRR